MERLELNHFKAFNNTLILDNAGGKNILLFGENGAGKSSIFSAIEYIFYRSKIEAPNPMLPIPDQQAELAAVREKYKNNQSAVPFELKFNGVNALSVNVVPYQVFMLNRFGKVEKVSLYDILSKNILPIDVNTFLSQNYSFIIDNVNNELEHSFLDEVRIKEL